MIETWDHQTVFVLGSYYTNNARGALQTYKRCWTMFDDIVQSFEDQPLACMSAVEWTMDIKHLAGRSARRSWCAWSCPGARRAPGAR